MKNLFRLIHIHIWFMIIISPSLFPQQNWQKFYGGKDDECIYSMRQTTDGGYIMVGYSYSFGSGGSDVYVLKINSNGDTLWTRTFGGLSDDVGYSIEHVDGDGFIITGSTESGGNNIQIYIIKISDTGDKVWSKTYGDIYKYTSSEILHTSEGGYIITGTVSANSYSKVCLLRINEAGDTLWAKYFGSGSEKWYGTSVRQASDGGYIIAGARSGDISLIKTTSDGDTLWTRVYAKGSNPKIKVTSDGGYIISATSTASNYTPLLIKTDEKGNVIWTHLYDYNSTFTYGKSVIQTSDGGYVLIGERMLPVDRYFIFLTRINADGDTLWNRQFVQGSANAVIETTDGDYIVAGRAFDFKNPQAFLLKTDRNGLTDTYDEGTTSKPSNFELSQNYPNPFNPITTITYSVAEDIFVNIKIYDLLGREIAEPVNEYKPAGRYKIMFNGNNFSSGIYFYRITAGNFTTKRKMVLIK